MNTKVVRAIDEYLDQKGLSETTPVEVASYLDRKGILKDSKDRPGKPLRDLLRKGEIPNAHQNGNRWVIRRSKLKFQNNVVGRITVPGKPKVTASVTKASTHKLQPFGEAISQLISDITSETCEIHYEYKPSWLTSYPKEQDLAEYPILEDIYRNISGHDKPLGQMLEMVSPGKRKSRQPFDIWIEHPFQCAIEFDEMQHFNQFRYATLSHYDRVNTGFSVKYYRQLNEGVLVKPGSSGFQKLQSNDPIFPPALKGSRQDNRIRQRAFRDVLKDVFPLVQGASPTIRTPYHLTSMRIKDFSQQDVDNVVAYVSKFLPIGQ